MDQEAQGLTLQLASQLVELLNEPKIEVRYGALNAILQYTSNKQKKQLFKGTPLFKILLKNYFTPQLTKLCLSNAINFSSQQDFLDQFKGFAEPLIYGLKQCKQLEEQLTLLFILNISKDSDIIEQIIGKQQKQGFLIQVLYGFIENKPQRRWIITNIFANITSIEEGRKFLTKSKIYTRFFKYMIQIDERLRMGILKMLRNMSFQWEDETFITQILKQQHLFLDRMGYLMIMIIQQGNLLQSQKQKVQNLLQKYRKIFMIHNILKTTKDQSILALELGIDVIIILSNCNFPQKKPPIQQNYFRQLIGYLKFTQIKQEFKDKLQAIETFCFW